MYDGDELIKIKILEQDHEYLLPLIKDVFKNENIEFQIKSNYDTAYNGIFIAQKGIGSIYVFKKDKERAEKILSQIITKK